MATGGPVIACIMPPIERTFVEMVPDAEPLYADVVMALVHLRKKRKEWMTARLKKAEYFHNALVKELGL